MTKRSNQMQWIRCVLVFFLGSAWSPVNAYPGARDRPSPIETQAKFFQDFFSVQLSPYKIEFGHVCEDPNTWEQRYEKKDYKNHRDMGKVRWGDKKGGYGEHYWDLNHAGHTGDHDNGDYDTNSHHDHDSYHEPSEESAKYETDDKTQYEESERIKRGNAAKSRKDLERRDQYSANIKNNHDQEDVITEQKRRSEEIRPREKNHIVLVLNHKDRPNRDNVRQSVPYENGAGVRRHQNLESSASQLVPRLFFESSTGRVIDRSTGQAYVLQPVNVNY